MSYAEERALVLKTCLELAEAGYLAGTGGNVAMRVSETEFAVTPSGTDYYAMTADDICILTLADLNPVFGEKKASVEAGMHAKVLLKKPNCKVSIHTHQPIASAYTLFAKSFIPTTLESKTALGDHVPCVGYAPSGTGILAWRVGRIFNDSVHACLMRNHGVVCVGESIEQAKNRVAILEQSCAEYFRQAADQKNSPVTPVVQSQVVAAMNTVLNS